MFVINPTKTFDISFRFRSAENKKLYDLAKESYIKNLEIDLGGISVEMKTLFPEFKVKRLLDAMDELWDYKMDIIEKRILGRMGVIKDDQGRFVSKVRE